MNRSSHSASRKPGARWPVFAVGLGTAILITVGVAACQSETPADIVPPAASVSPAATTPAVEVPVQDGGLPSPDKADPPVKMRIPALKLDASVVPVGVDETGEFDVPPSVDRVGWYRFGPGMSATAGSIVIAGHVDSADQGEGAFFRLGSLSAKDRITLVDRSGSTRVFQVVGRERYEKTRIPLDKYFARDGVPRLTLITCGGPFDPETSHYRDNVVVTAIPVE